MEMNQMFDFYDGGGLDMTFLGAAEISARGDVNVSRMSKNRLTGPGGFIDISSCTRDVYFMAPFTAVGLEVECSEDGEGSLKILSEGKVKKFVSEVYEKTFSGDEAVRRGQFVYFVTERAVFRRTSSHDVIELIEIAPGVDLQKDILDLMEFTPAISPNLKLMDPRIFRDEKMNAASDFFGSLDERCSYHADDHTMYIDLFGITLNSEDDVRWFFSGLREILARPVQEHGKINIVVSYDGFNLASSLEEMYSKEVDSIQKDLYKSARRYTGQAFQRARLKTTLSMDDWDPEEIYDRFDTRKDGVLSVEELREGFLTHFRMTLTPEHIKEFVGEKPDQPIDREAFIKGIMVVLGEKK